MRRIVGDRAHQRHILVLHAATEPVRQQLLRNHLDELIGIARQPAPQACRPVDFRPIENLSGRIDRRALVVTPPHADAIEVLQREADRIHEAVALDAVGPHPVIHHLLPHRRLARIAGRVACFRLERWHVGRRVGRAHAEDVRHDPLPARDRRGSFRLGGRREKRAFAEQSAPHVQAGIQVHAPELAAVDIRNAVVPGEPLVDERIVRGQQIEHIAILADDAVEEQFDFTAHGAAQRIVEVGIDHRQRTHAVHPAQVQPLPGEIDRQRFGARIREHAPDLPFEDRRIFQLALARQRDQGVVGHSAPEKERQPRCQFQIADPVELSGLDVRGLHLDPVNQPRIGEDARERHLDARVEVAVLAARLIEVHQRLNFGIRDRMPERARCQRGDDFPRARRLVGRGRWPAHEDPAAARRVPGRRGVERTFDSQRPHVREEREPGRGTGLERVAHEVLIEIEHRREIRLRERGADHVRSRGGGEPHGHFRDLVAQRERASSARAGCSAAGPGSASALSGRCARRTAAIGLRSTEAPAALPVQQLHACAVEQDLELFARDRAESRRRHVVAENRRDGHRILAVGGEHVLDEQPASRAEGQPFDVVVL